MDMMKRIVTTSLLGRSMKRVSHFWEDEVLPVLAQRLLHCLVVRVVIRVPAGLKRLPLSVERCERPAELHLAGCAVGFRVRVCALRSQRFSACQLAGCNLL